MARNTSKTAAEYYRTVADLYKLETGQPTIEISEAVAWALSTNQLQMSPDDVARWHAERMSEALRSDVAVDDYGRRYRLRHCIVTRVSDDDGRPRQRCLWAHMDDADDDFMIASLTHRRSQIRDDIEALRADRDEYNRRRLAAGKRPIQLPLEFADDGRASSAS